MQSNTRVDAKVKGVVHPQMKLHRCLLFLPSVKQKQNYSRIPKMYKSALHTIIWGCFLNNTILLKLLL